MIENITSPVLTLELHRNDTEVCISTIIIIHYLVNINLEQFVQAIQAMNHLQDSTIK